MSWGTTFPTRLRLRSACLCAQSDQSLIDSQWIAKDLMCIQGDREDIDQSMCLGAHAFLFEMLCWGG